MRATVRLAFGAGIGHPANTSAGLGSEPDADLCARSEAQFVQDVFDVRSDGPFGDDELRDGTVQPLNILSTQRQPLRGGRTASKPVRHLLHAAIHNRRWMRQYGCQQEGT